MYARQAMFPESKFTCTFSWTYPQHHISFKYCILLSKLIFLYKSWVMKFKFMCSFATRRFHSSRSLKIRVNWIWSKTSPPIYLIYLNDMCFFLWAGANLQYRQNFLKASATAPAPAPAPQSDNPFPSPMPIYISRLNYPTINLFLI